MLKIVKKTIGISLILTGVGALFLAALFFFTFPGSAILLDVTIAALAAGVMFVGFDWVKV